MGLRLRGGADAANETVDAEEGGYRDLLWTVLDAACLVLPDFSCFSLCLPTPPILAPASLLDTYPSSIQNIGQQY